MVIAFILLIILANILVFSYLGLAIISNRKNDN